MMLRIWATGSPITIPVAMRVIDPWVTERRYNGPMLAGKSGPKTYALGSIRMVDDAGLDGGAGKLPDGEYAIVEILGYSTLVGRIAEVERFGTKMMAVECLFRGELLPVIFQGGASIYRMTPCSKAVAWHRGPKHTYQLPPAVAAIVPPELLPPPELEPAWNEAETDEDDQPF